MLPRIVLLIVALNLWVLAASAETKDQPKLPAKDSAVADPAAEKAWKDLLDSMKPPAPPADWAGTTPTPEQKVEFSKFLATASQNAAAKAHDFYTKYPNDNRADEARQREKRMLQQAAVFEKQSAPPGEQEKLRAKLNEAVSQAMAKKPEGLPKVLAELEKQLKTLLKEYPKEPAVWGQFMLIAQNGDEATAKRVANEVIQAENAPDDVKDAAKEILKRLDSVGQPFEMAFTAVDGRQVDVQKMQGKVVLIDFWATWCGPCVAELPNVKRAYNTYHPKGFEIVGISLDKDKRALESFVKENEMQWPQYFDGKGWGNKFSLQNNISAIPSMFLVDKKGKLRDLSAREDLEEKVAKMLMEN
jgi:thiol-disulfide isomerase/thioredoxin